MSIIQTVKRIYPGLGSPTVYFANQNFNITNGNTTVSLPVGSNVQANQVGIGPVTCGIVRVKSEALGTFVNTGNTFPNNTQIRVLNIWGDDGATNVVQLYEGDSVQTSSTSNLNIDRIYPFNCDLPLANVNVAINIQGVNSVANAVFSVEVAAGP